MEDPERQNGEDTEEKVREVAERLKHEEVLDNFEEKWTEMVTKKEGLNITH